MFLAPSSVSSPVERPLVQAGVRAGADERRVVVLPEGLHARPSSALARLAMRFDAKVTLIWKTSKANAASILELLALGAPSGDSVEIEASGAQAEEALLAVRELIERRFDRALAQPAK
jgi:phosphotransferase system HPr (HPr) family protein